MIKVTRISGAERHLLILLPALRQLGIDARLMLLVEPDHLMDNMVALAEERGIPVQRVIIRRDYDLSLIWKLVRLLRSTSPDLVHTHLIHADLFGLAAGRLAGVPVRISSRHNDDAFRKHWAVRRLNQTLGWLSAGVIAISDSIREFVIAVEGIRAEKVSRVYYGMDLLVPNHDQREQARQTLRNELGLAQDAVVIGTACRLTEQKGLAFALQAIQQVHERGVTVEFVIAGDGELREELTSEAQQRGIADHVHFLGWREDVADVMLGYDVFVLPSLWEGFGLVLLEVMSLGIPIIASKVSAIPEVVGDTGVLVPPKQVDAIAEAVLRLTNNPDLRQEIGERGVERLQSHFSVEKMAQATIAIYQKYQR